MTPAGTEGLLAQTAQRVTINGLRYTTAPNLNALRGLQGLMIHLGQETEGRALALLEDLIDEHEAPYWPWGFPEDPEGLRGAYQALCWVDGAQQRAEQDQTEEGLPWGSRDRWQDRQDLSGFREALGRLQ